MILGWTARRSVSPHTARLTASVVSLVTAEVTPGRLSAELTNYCTAGSGPTLDASNDFLFDLQRKQVERKLTVEEEEEVVSNSSPEVEYWRRETLLMKYLDPRAGWRRCE